MKKEMIPQVMVEISVKNDFFILFAPLVGYHFVDDDVAVLGVNFKLFFSYLGGFSLLAIPMAFSALFLGMARTSAGSIQEINSSCCGSLEFMFPLTSMGHIIFFSMNIVDGGIIDQWEVSITSKELSAPTPSIQEDIKEKNHGNKVKVDCLN